MSLEVLDDSRWSLVLAIVAHPDDLEHGATSAVVRWTSRGVSYVLATRGESASRFRPPEEAAPLRQEEHRRSAAVVAVDNVIFLDTGGVIE